MAKTTVEAFAGAHTVRGATAGIAFRQVWKPKPLFTLNPEAPDVSEIVRRIAEVERSRGCSAYLFIDAGLQVYVVSEEKPFMQEILRNFAGHAWFPWFVACYRTVRPADKALPVMRPSPEGVLEDVIDHLKSLTA